MSKVKDTLQLVAEMYDHKMTTDRSMWRLLIAQKDKQLEAKEKKIQELLKKQAKGFSFDMMEDFPSVPHIQQRYRLLVQEDRQDIVDTLSELHNESLNAMLGQIIQECFDESLKMYLHCEFEMIRTAAKNLGVFENGKVSQDTSILVHSFASWCRKNFKNTSVYNQLKKKMQEGDSWKRFYVFDETPSLKSKLDQFLEDCCTVCWWMHCSANKLTLVGTDHYSYPCLMGPDSQVLLPVGKITE